MVRFTRKKIDSLTLGERMKRARTDRRLGLSDVSRMTKIQVKYLEYLEEGEYAKLPADVYVKGFLRSYALHIGMNEKSLVRQFEREKNIHKNIKKIPENEKRTHFPLKFSTFVITPKVIIIVLIAVVSLGSVAYLYREVDSFVSTPRLILIKPGDGQRIDGSTVRVEGIAEKDSLVFINDQKVLANEKGEFGENISLKSGLNAITVKVKNRFDKETVKSVSVSADLQEQTAPEEQTPPEEQTAPEERDETEKDLSENPENSLRQ